MKKFVKTLITAILLSAVLCTFFACDFLQTSEDTKKTDGELTVTEKKISFDQAESNYNAKGAKSVTSTLSFDFTLFLDTKPADNYEDPVPYTLNTEISAKRISDGEKTYFSTKIEDIYDDNSKVVGLLEIIKTMINSNDESLAFLIGTFGSNNEVLNSLLQQIASYIDYAQDLILGRFNVSAELGKAEEITNFKGEYTRYIPNETNQHGDIWCAVSDEFIQRFLGDEIDLDDFASGVLPSVFFDFDKGTDVASERVDKNGIARYDVNFGLDGAGSFLTSIVNKITDEQELNTEQIAAMRRIVEKIISCVSTSSSSNFNAVVGDNKLPSKATSTINLKINVSMADLREIFNDLVEAELITEDVKSAVLLLTALIGNYARGTDGQKNVIGIELTFMGEETYSYETSKYDLSGVDQDLFEGEGNVDGRYSVEDYVNVMTVEQVTARIDDVLEKLDQEDKEYVVAKIYEKIATAKTTLINVNKGIYDALSETVTEQVDFVEVINEILAEFFQ